MGLDAAAGADRASSCRSRCPAIIGGPPHRRRLDDLDRDDRRVPAAEGPRRTRSSSRSRQPTPFKTEIYAAGVARGRARARRATRCSSCCAGCSCPWTRAGSHDRRRRQPRTFLDAFRFIADHPGLLAHEGDRAARARGRGARDRARGRAAGSGSSSATCTAARRRDRHVDRRPRAAEPRPDRRLPDRARHRLRQQHGRARRARAPARS